MSLIALANWAGLSLAATAAIVVGFTLYRRPVVFQERQTVIVFAGFWIAALLFEFYALGPDSFISMNIDGNVGATFFTYLIDRHLGGQFAHSYGGGHDIDTVLGFGTQYFSVERILFSLLPTWLAILTLKVAVAATGFSGAYKLCRITGPADRTVSAGLAALFTLTFFYNINATTWNGLGYSVLPWVIYLSFARDNRRHYLGGLLILGLGVMTTEPLHTFLAIVAAVIAGAVLLNKVSVRTVVIPLVILFGFMAANWFEVLFALKQIAPLTIRGNVSFGDYTFLEAVGRAINFFPVRSVGSITIIMSIMALAYRRQPFVWNVLGAMVSILVCYVALAWLPWELVGLKTVKGLSSHYLYFSLGALMLPTAVRAIGAMTTVSGRAHKPWPAAMVFAGAVAMLVLYKVENGVNYVYYGGQSQYSTIENLANPDWSRKKPFRVVTLRHQRPEPELAAAFYGMDTYDGTLNLTPVAYSTYWRDGILKAKGNENFMGRLTMERRYFTGDTYDINDQANLALLRAANVAFIISPVPLKGDIRLVSGPDVPPARFSDGFEAFVMDRLSRVLRYGKVYVYALDQPLPRAFAARAIHRVGSGVKETDLLKIISTLAPVRTVVVRWAAKVSFFADNLKSMRVLRVAKTINGYDAVTDAPDGGVLVLNVPHLPFWTARDDRGNTLEVFPVNMVHMAVAVPPGTKSVSFRYQRPTLWGKAMTFFGGP